MTIPVLISVLFPVTFRHFFRWLTASRNVRMEWPDKGGWDAGELVVSRDAEVINGRLPYILEKNQQCRFR